ncbi:MAG: hypothetical protein Q8L48_09020 [Archangium sp.]|nr:hypothetical protein [Archangium sp.]
MPTLMLALLIAAAPVVEDRRGFTFTVPAGFEPFPGFKPTATKLYAFGKNLGTPGALTLTIDVLDGPATPGASRSCATLANSFERTVSSPSLETWLGQELSGARLVMTHVFGEVLVFCVDVPVLPNGLSVMISGKPGNEAILRETFRATLASIRTDDSPMGTFAPIGLALIVALVALSWKMSRHRRGK